ncbi:MAG: hypothetical protein J3Q66DRAFT_369115 [Benniella sp.]|nr:MAG: hypothetical protein J3Q66DRAFT_369115 [Benniella sp.]
MVTRRVQRTKADRRQVWHPSQTTGTIVHIDEPPTTQKQRARDTRAARQAKSEAAFSSVAKEIGELVDGVSNTTNPRFTWNRLVKLTKRANQTWANARKVDTATRDALAKGLEDLGWSVRHCTSESDVCIGRKVRKDHGAIVAASTDSDVVSHPCLHQIDVANILEQLEVEHDQWVVTAATTNNDYTKQASGQRFAKNLEVVRYRHGSDKKQILDQYCEELKLDNDTYKAAEDIHNEIIMDMPSTNEPVDTIKLKEDLQTDMTRPEKYVVSGTILTNGHEVKIHAFSFAHPKKKKGVDGTSAKTSTGRSAKYIRTMFPNPETLHQTFGDQDINVVLAIDPGTKATVTAAVVDSAVPDKTMNISFPWGSHTSNSNMYRNFLQKKKRECVQSSGTTSNIHDLEASIPSTRRRSRGRPFFRKDESLV